MKITDSLLSYNNLKRLFEKYHKEVLNHRILNASPHEAKIGRIVIPPGNPMIVEIFSVYKRYVFDYYDRETNIEYYKQILEPQYIDFKNNIIRAVEDLDLYVLASMLTVEAFNHPRIIRLLNVFCDSYSNKIAAISSTIYGDSRVVGSSLSKQYNREVFSIS